MATAGALSYDDLLALTKQALGGRNSGLMTDAWYGDRINSAYARLCTFQGDVLSPGAAQVQRRVVRFFELYYTDTATISTGLSSNFITPTHSAHTVCYVDDIYDLTNKRQIRRKSIRYMLGKDPTETGSSPRMWCPSGAAGGTGYYLNPIPASTAFSIRERVYVFPEALATGGANDPVIPAAWHPPIWMAAAAEAASLIDWPEKMQEMENMFTKFIATNRSPVEESGGAGGRRYFGVGG